MKNALVSAIAVLFLAGSALAKPPRTVPPFPGTLVNATYVYVTSYDGDQFNPNLLPEDRQAIAAVEDAIQNWGHFVLVYTPREADIVLMVESRPSEDILAMYDAHGWPNNNFLWRETRRAGLQKGETPLVSDLKSAFEKATK